MTVGHGTIAWESGGPFTFLELRWLQDQPVA